MRVKRFLLSVMLILSLVLNMPLPASAASKSEIIRDLLNYYSHYQDNAKTDIIRLLEELEELDPEAAQNWLLIMDRWHWACTQLEVTPEVLPDGLPEDDSLCIVVMGFELNYDGSMKEELIGRLETALASARKYPNAYILCTGGGTAYGNPEATEAGAMAYWLREQGIDPHRIIVENRSISTEQNSLYSFQILSAEYPQVDSVALISSDYHLRRCYVLFNAALALTDSEDRYTIVGNAGYDAGHEGDEGLFIEAESIGLMVDLYVKNLEPPVRAQLTEITVQGDTAYTAGDELNLTVTALYDRDVIRDVTAEAVVSGYDPSVAGNQEVTVEYTENGITASATIHITVTAPPTEATAASTTVPATVPTQPPSVTEPLEEPRQEHPHIAVFLLPLGLAAGLTILLLVLIRNKKKHRGKYLKREK